MKNPIRFTSLLLCLIMLAASAAACSSNEDAKTETTADTAVELSAETTPDETVLPASLDKDLNYDGYTYVIYSYDNSLYRGTFIAESENGDPVNDAVYTRNRAVEEKYGVVIKGLLLPADNDTTKNNIRKSVAA